MQDFSVLHALSWPSRPKARRWSARKYRKGPAFDHATQRSRARIVPNLRWPARTIQALAFTLPKTISIPHYQFAERDMAVPEAAPSSAHTPSGPKAADCCEGGFGRACRFDHDIGALRVERLHVVVRRPRFGQLARGWSHGSSELQPYIEAARAQRHRRQQPEWTRSQHSARWRPALRESACAVQIAFSTTLRRLHQDREFRQPLRDQRQDPARRSTAISQKYPCRPKMPRSR